MAGFGLGKIKELQEAFQKAQQVQAGAQKLQEELEQMEIEGSSEDGLVKVVMSGNQEPRGVTIAPEALEKGAESLANLVTEAMKAAYVESTDTMRSKMEELTSGLNLPGCKGLNSKSIGRGQGGTSILPVFDPYTL